MFYAALDVSLRSVAIAIIDEAEKVRLERSLQSDVSDIVARGGLQGVCMEARQVNAAPSAMLNMTDKTMRAALPHCFDRAGITPDLPRH